MFTITITLLCNLSTTPIAIVNVVAMLLMSLLNDSIQIVVTALLFPLLCDIVVLFVYSCVAAVDVSHCRVVNASLW